MSISVPPDNHKFHIRSIFADSTPDVHGENGTATVKDGGQGGN